MSLSTVRHARKMRLVSLLTMFTMLASLLLIAPPLVAQATCSACTIWSTSTVPTMGPANSNAYELGVRFQSARAGYISGVRFYKSADNTSPHTASLWSLSDGKLLASAAFMNETASGWQEAHFITPVAITASVTYIASYHSNYGPYAQDNGYFSQGSVTNGPLTALDGAYAGGRSAFPGGTYEASNYWVDPVFTDSGNTLSQTIQRTSLFPENAAPTSLMTDPYELGTRIRTNQSGYITSLRFYKHPQATGIHVGSLWDENGTLLGRATFSNETESGWQEARLPTSVAIDAHKSYVVSYHADAGATYELNYFNSTDFNGPLYGTVDSVGGNGLWGSAAGVMPTNGGSHNYWADVVFSSAPLSPTLESQGTARSIWETSTYTPTISSGGSPIEVGIRFQSARDGHIQGVRFFKGATNTGEHIGNLWSDSGQLLASAIFQAETESGWQEIVFANSVPISANTTYVASYHTNSGAVARTGGYFQSFPAKNAPLSTTGAGVYRYGPSGFPSQTYENSNYWVDVVFSDDPSDDPLVFEDETIWSDSAQPANPSNPNNTLVQLGVKIKADRTVLVKGMHYFNGDTSVTTHTARLWKGDGTLLKSKTFSNGPTIGWQYVYFDNSVPIHRNTTYVMSYDTTTAYPSTSGGLNVPAPTEFPAIRALAHGEDGGNGVYSYDTNFPTQSYYGGNYWVDVIVSDALEVCPLGFKCVTRVNTGPQYFTQRYRYTGPEGLDIVTYHYVKVNLNDPDIGIVPQGANNHLPALRNPDPNSPAYGNLTEEPYWDDNKDHKQKLIDMYNSATADHKAVMINTDYFCRDGCTGNEGSPQGLFVKDGTVYHRAPIADANNPNASGPRAALFFSASGYAAIGDFDWDSNLTGIHNAVSGGPILLKNGNIDCSVDDKPEGRCDSLLERRSGACISSNGYTLWLVATSSREATYPTHFAAFMKFKLGCSNGMQFDGGTWTPQITNSGSPSLIVNGKAVVTGQEVGTGLLITYEPPTCGSGC